MHSTNQEILRFYGTRRLITVLTTDPYAELDEPNPHPHTLFLKGSILILPSQALSSIQIFPPNFFMNFSSLPYVLHVPPTSVSSMRPP